jgi:hypothetical protein
MKTVSARQANHEFSDLLSRVERGEEILITKRSKCRTSQNRGSLYETEMARTKPRSRCGGTGLALPLTKALAEANRANFNIKSAPNACIASSRISLQADG